MTDNQTALKDKQTALIGRIVQVIDEFPPTCEVYLKDSGGTILKDSKARVIGYQFCHLSIVLRVSHRREIKTVELKNVLKVDDVYAIRYDGMVISTLTLGSITPGEHITVFLQDAGEIKNLVDDSVRPYYRVSSIVTNNGANIEGDELENFEFSFISSDKIYKVNGKDAEFSLNLSPDTGE